MSAKILSFYDYDRERSISRPCGWSSICSESEEQFREVFDVRCQECDRMLLIVEYPTHEETRRAAAVGNEKAKEHLELVVDREAFFARAAEHKLTETGQLPDLEGDDLVILWDFEDGRKTKDEDSWTILRHGDRIIWREVAFYEGIDRFKEVLWILRERCGTRMAELQPTDASITWLYGDDIWASHTVKSLNADLRELREPSVEVGFIDVEDADGEPDDPARQENELRASVKAMGPIDCACGWEGEATEARVNGTGNQREVACPECRWPLFRLTLDME